MNPNPPSLPPNFRRAEEFRKTVKALLITAAILAVLGCLALVIGKGVFTMNSPRPLHHADDGHGVVGIIGAICFVGCIPLLFLAGLSAVGGVLISWLSFRIPPIDEAEHEEEVC